MYNVFVYGTLLYAETLHSVLNQEYLPKNIDGRLQGYEPRVLPHAPFPGLVPIWNGSCEGKILLNITKDQLARLDRYEGEGCLYKRIFVHVKASTNELYGCWTYLYLDETTDYIWNPDNRKVLI